MVRRRLLAFRAARPVAAALPGLLVLAVLVATPACGRKKAERAHGTEEAAAAPVPTPDNTPIDVLRTPAGLVLKTEEPTPARETPVPATPAPAPVTTVPPAPPSKTTP